MRSRLVYGSVAALLAVAALLTVIGWDDDPAYLEQHDAFNQTFDVALHLGALVAVGAYFWRDIVALALFEPDWLRDQVSASWALEATVDTAEACRRLGADQVPFHVAEPEGPLVQQLIAADRVVYRPEVLRHFAAGGD